MAIPNRASTTSTCPWVLVYEGLWGQQRGYCAPFTCRLRRVAKKDADGNLVKLPAYDDLLDRATRPTVEGCCCDLLKASGY